MVSYWSAFLECSYANAAFLDWFGKPDSTDVVSLNLAELLGHSLATFEPFLMEVLNGVASDFEIAWQPTDGRDLKYALFRLVPDFSGEVVRGFMFTGINLPTMRQDGKRNAKATEGGNAESKGLPEEDSLVVKMEHYSEELKELLSAYWSSTTASAESRLALGYVPEEGMKMFVRDTGSETFTSEVNLYDCVSKAVSSIEEELKSGRCSVRIRVSPFIYVHANPKYMESIIRNFIGNALVHRATDRVPVIDVSSMVVGNETILSIKDNGKGLDLDFFYGTSAHYSNGEAVQDDIRARLFTVRQQVYAMGGYIGVESEPDGGTWFRIYFKTKLDQFY